MRRYIIEKSRSTPFRWYSGARRSSGSDLSNFNVAYSEIRPARTGTLALSPGLRCSFANPSGRPAGNGLNTNFQFVRAYRPGAQGRDTNARCNQRIAKESALQRNPRVNPRSSSAVTLPAWVTRPIPYFPPPPLNPERRRGCLPGLWYHFHILTYFMYRFIRL